MAYAGGMAIVGKAIETGPPEWPDYGATLSYLPWLSVTLGSLTNLIVSITAVVLVVATQERLREKGRVWVLPPFLLVLGLTGASNPPGTPWMAWIGTGVGVAAAVTLLWFLCRKWGWAILPGVVAAPTILALLKLMTLQPHPGCSTGAALGLLGLLVVVRIWTRALQGPTESTAAWQPDSRAGPGPRYTP
jgi:hypothetical protein